MKIHLLKAEDGKYSSSSSSTERVTQAIPTTLTRRMLLRQTASIFGPLGLITPFTIRGKLLMRDLTLRRLPDSPVNWDEQIEERNKWLKYLFDMVSLERIRFRRCMQPPGMSGQPILIIFADASSQAYAACAYARWTLSPERGEACREKSHSTQPSDQYTASRVMRSCFGLPTD